METIRRPAENQGRAEAENSARKFQDQHFEENEDSQGKTNLEFEEVEQSGVCVCNGGGLSGVGYLSARYRWVAGLIVCVGLAIWLGWLGYRIIWPADLAGWPTRLPGLAGWVASWLVWLGDWMVWLEGRLAELVAWLDWLCGWLVWLEGWLG